MFKFLGLFLIINLALASDVLEFKDSDFEENISEHSIIFVEFYAPWCGHCQQLESQYNIAASILKNSGPPVPLAKVDCTVETKTCEKYGISGYPTLKLFKNGAFAYDYTGERNAEAILNYLKTKYAPASRLCNNLEDMKAVETVTTSVVFGYFIKEGSDLDLTFQTVAGKINEDIKFARTFNEDVAKSIGIDEGIYILYPKHMASKFEEPIIKYKGDLNEPDIEAWIEANLIGLAGLLTSSTLKYFKKPLIVAYYNTDYEKNPKGTNYLRNRLMKLVKKFVDSGKKIHLSISSSIENRHELVKLGIENPDREKVYIAVINEQNKKFKMEDEFSMDNFEKFINEFLEQKVKAYVYSEDIPSENRGPVKVVVAKNFDAIVNDPTKDVLLEFYSPSCGHCRSLAPKLENLARTLYFERDIVIAKMDATVNDVPIEYKITGYPFLYFVPKKQKSSPKRYTGKREVVDFIKYIAAESTDALKGFDRGGNPIKSDL